MQQLDIYVPIDRLQALARSEPLPDHVWGTALFADLSGFTALTEMLVQDLGPQRGAEELLVFLDMVYEPLVYQVHHFGGSVIGFSGDAITCWFDDDFGLRAATCAVVLQNEMQAFRQLTTSSNRSISMGLKVGISTGNARRFLIGNPAVQVMDVLAGYPLEGIAGAEHQASRGEILLDQAAVDQLVEVIEISEWRQDESTGERYAVLGALHAHAEPQPWPEIPEGTLSAEAVRPWLLPPVYQRLESGKGEWLAELRPAVALFLRFGGFDFEKESSGQEMDFYIRQVQEVLTHYDGSLIQITIGEKGSYLAAAFGAPIAHEDDSLRAVSAAIDLRRICPTSDRDGLVEIGISRGQMRTGAYGSQARRTYGILGPQTNLAARLMQTAAPGQILISGSVQKAVDELVQVEALPPVKLKGVAEPVPVFNVGALKSRSSMQLQEPRYSLPMIGRHKELAAIAGKLSEALNERGQVVLISGEAGLGKSRLLAEAVVQASRAGFQVYAGECQSYGANTSYHLWFGIWRSFFDLDPAWPVEQSIETLRLRLEAVDPQLVNRLPLLGVVLNLPIPENDLTRPLDGKLRKTLLEGLLVTCLRSRARQAPLAFALEDCHWMDPLSADLALAIVRSIAGLPVLMLIARRPFEAREAAENPFTGLPYYTALPLTEFTAQEAEQLIRFKLEQFFGSQTRPSPGLLQHIRDRAQGNPFYLEELLNYLKDRGVEPQEWAALEQLDLPGSLHSLILSRIDQCTESQKITLKVASVIGRLFAAAWLWGAYPDLGDPDAVLSDLDVLSRMEITPVDQLDPELTYLFKHIITQDVTYESLPYSTRAALHNQVGQYIERSFTGELSQVVDLLAFHYGRSNNEVKKREYLLKAGQSAQANYANQAAIHYYQSLLPLVEGLEKIDVILKLGQVLGTVGKWDEAKDLYLEGLKAAGSLGDRQGARRAQARCQAALGELFRKRSAYPEATRWLEQAREGFDSVDDPEGLGQVLHSSGTLAAQQGDYPAATSYYYASLALRQMIGDQTNIANLYNNLGVVARYERDDEECRRLYLKSLAIRRELGDRFGIAVSLNNLGILSKDLGELDEARTYLVEALTLIREIGDQYYLANILNNMGNVARARENFDNARRLYHESLAINRELGDRWQLAYILEDIGMLAGKAGAPERALTLIAAASVLRDQIKSPMPPHELARLERHIGKAKSSLSKAQQAAAWEAGRGMPLEEAIGLALKS